MLLSRVSRYSAKLPFSKTLMLMPKLLNRNFAMSDNDMLTESKTKVELAKGDLEALKKVEPSLTLEQLELWNANIDACLNDFTSLESKAAITIATQKVNDLMEHCKGELQILYFHVNREFASNAAAAIEFGERGIENARKSPEKMIRQISLVTTVAGKPEYKERLSKRLPVGFMDSLNESKGKLNEAMVQQSVAKTSQPADTEERIAKFNAVWSFIHNISEIGKIAFRDSYAKQQQYNLYDTPAAKKEGDVPKKESSEAAQEE